MVTRWLTSSLSASSGATEQASGRAVAMPSTHWRNLRRPYRWTIIGAFIGMVAGTIFALTYGSDGTIFDRCLVASVGVLAGSGSGLLVAGIAEFRKRAAVR
jgi:drug/metabolite transporter (DMT)-like permease